MSSSVVPSWPTSTTHERRKRAIGSPVSQLETACISSSQTTMMHGWKAEPSAWGTWNDAKDPGVPRLRQLTHLSTIGPAQRKARMEVRRVRGAQGPRNLQDATDGGRSGSRHTRAQAGEHGPGGCLMVKEPEEYTDVGAELRRLDQNIEGLMNKFQRQSQMLVRVDQLEERVEKLEQQLEAEQQIP